MEALNKKEVVNVSDVSEYDLRAIGFSGDVPALFSSCSFLTVNSENHSSVEEIPELIYIAPYFKAPDGAELGITNIFSVLLKKDQDVVKLEELAKKYNLIVLGQSIHRTDMYFLSCIKDSKGNALEMANYFYETNLFKEATPEFLIESHPIY